MRFVLLILAILFGVLGIAVALKDIAATDRSWFLVGEIWFQWAPTSLQVSEAIISRYIDPCGLVVSLGCEPFLWDPIISTVLQWYASPSFFISAFVLALVFRFLNKRN